MEDKKSKTRLLLKQLQCCVIMPTYNNEKTVGKMISSILEYTDNLIVVVDGATDNTPTIVSSFKEKISLLQYEKNVGKGHALKMGFKEALKQGFEYAITIDSDGQHFADDISLFAEKLKENPNTLLMGSRNIMIEGMPQKNSFANKFSNFWVKLQTGNDLPDTQTGFRLYPLKAVEKLCLFTSKFEFEVEIQVKLAWQNIKVLSVPIQVKYDPTERVTHFRPLQDFTRISLLNTYLTILTILWYFHKRQLLKIWNIGIWNTLKQEAIKPQESNISKALSIAFGFFIGIMPLFGFQLLIGIPLAIFLRLNKVLVLVFSHISIPPMIPFIIYISYKIGGIFINNPTQINDIKTLNLQSIHINFIQYFIGGWLFALTAAVITFIISFSMLSVLRKK